ncbi:MAG TPA: serine protease [Pseudonocardia sp.]|nr:serine protease [Pseudonocardia sp.]
MLHAVAALVAAAVLGVAGPASAAAAGPAVPGQGSSGEPISPGILMLSPVSESAANACTASFVFKSGGTTYLGYAAHCAGTSLTGLSGCREKTLPLGSTVLIERGNGASSTGRLAYNSWATMQRRGETDQSLCMFNDFALVALDPSDAGEVDPSVPILGGPTALDTDGLRSGEPVFSYQPNNGGTVVKEGKTVSDSGGGRSHRVNTTPPGRPGDSGSGYLDGNGMAFGVLSTQFLDGTGTNGLTDLAMALTYANQYGGIGRVALVPGTEPFAPPG